MKKNLLYKKDFNFIKILFLFLFILLSVQVIQAQNKNYTHEFPQTFTKKIANEYTGEAIPLHEKPTYKFATISAYCLNNSLQTTFYYRVSINNTWQSWKKLTEDKEVNNTKRKVYGLVTIFEKFDKIQFKSSKKVTDEVNFRLFYSVKNEIKPNTTKEILNCDLPNSCDRSCWCPSGNCDPQSSPYAIDVTHVIVHHSATNYSSGTDYAQVVYSYWDYHVNTHGWNDIGYNWLVDPNGILYEGRGDGIQGAHFSCMNGKTMGVCMIGNFETATPTIEAIATLENLIAWEVTDKELDVLANTYHPPSQLNLYTVSGHKDGNPSPVGCPSGTLCPGTNLYSELATIRTDVSGFPCYVSASIDEINSDTTVNVYPNPVTSILSIENLTNQPFQEISVYNTFGIQIERLFHDFEIVDFTKYTTGMYFITIIQNDNTRLTFKVIKE